MSKPTDPIDRSGWIAGPWDNEPDRDAWVDDKTGIACLALRNRLGAWCGYVGVREGHPWYLADNDIIDADAHGGLTWSGPNDGWRSHSESLWWVGFDTAHMGDLVPGMTAIHHHQGDDVYRDLAYVRAETAELALQASNAS